MTVSSETKYLTLPYLVEDHQMVNVKNVADCERYTAILAKYPIREKPSWRNVKSKKCCVVGEMSHCMVNYRVGESQDLDEISQYRNVIIVLLTKNQLGNCKCANCTL
jgi:hypothetical protein